MRVEDAQPEPMAMQSRPTRRGISAGLVYTPPELRGRGYATACLSELSRRQLASGWDLCALFADLANPISNGIFQRIAYEPVCDSHEMRFEKSGGDSSLRCVRNDRRDTALSEGRVCGAVVV